MQPVTSSFPSAARRLVALGVLLALTQAAVAQAPVWVGFDASPAGTPADVTLVESLSSPSRSVIDVAIHGFWKDDVLGGDGQTYQRLDFPGLPAMRTPGAPELPEARVLLAMATDAPNAVFVSAAVASQQWVSAIKVHPAPIPGEDEEWDPDWGLGPGDVVGTGEQFTIDPTIYGGGLPWPAAAGVGGDVALVSGPVPAASVAGWPAVWDVSAQRLTVKTSARYTFDHPGTVTPLPFTITKLKHKLYAKLFHNWAEAGPVGFAFETYDYHSRYLIVAQPWWWDELEPFVALKKAQGYEVTVVTALPDVLSIRNAIAAWYAQGNPGMDHFCLLVGDTLTVPLGLVNIGGVPVMTDDVYGCIGAVDQSKEVHVGRLSIDGEADLTHQLQKIIDYQVSPPPGARYDTALLVSHEEGYPGKYTGSHEDVLGAAYAHPPTFMVCHGGSGGTNQQVRNFITAGRTGGGLGLVAYRGHGSTTSWAGWTLAGDHWHNNHLTVLQNPVHPIVWSIACTNANIDWEWGTFQDSIAEVWMEVPDGAVASYAATQTTSTTPNHWLNFALFQAVYNHGITTHAMAIEAAEASLWAIFWGHKNPWAYLLLGDPSMTVRRDPVAELTLLGFPVSLSVDDAPDEYAVQALDGATGMPVVDGLLSYHKASFLRGAPDEMHAARWMNASGGGTLPLTFETPGTLRVVVRDEDGDQSLLEIPVGMGPAWTDLGHALGSPVGTPAMAGLGDLVGGAPWSLLVTGGPPGGTAWLCFGITRFDAPFKGGVMVPDINPPGFVLPVPLDESGDLRIDTTWPTGVPQGTRVFFQTWFADDAGVFGFTATNAVQGVTP